MNEKEKIYEFVLSPNKQKIEAHKAELMNKNKEEAKAQLDQDYNDTVANLENLYNQK